ncbi:hypothetical protein [uncultured Duncaniella sp.]|uniref:hypothetical protein n=1 Tax=uncultured Duncaniella sp. TaxID=2768039 RepID=UPI0025B054FF|nr:hypothetical protein [uncultured Duncaniella sp.]
MKDIIRLSIFGFGIAGLMAVACYLPSNTEQLPAALTSDELSWIEFCKARGYDTHDNRDEIINEFLDTWVGSMEEERAFNNLPAQEV